MKQSSGDTLCWTVQRGQGREQEAQEETRQKEDRSGARLEELVRCGARCGLAPRTLGAASGVQLGSDCRICILEGLTLRP